MRFLSMKKIFFAFVLCSGILGAAEFACNHDSIRYGKKQIRFLQQGTAQLLYESKCCLSGEIKVGTKGGYFSFGSHGINRKFINPENGFWEYSGTFPEDRKNTRMALKQSFELTPVGSMEVNVSWKASDPKNVKDTYYIVYLPMADFQGKSILVNRQEIPIVNETKYGFFQNYKMENPELTFYHWDKDRKIRIQGEGKMRIVFQTEKDKYVMVRFYPRTASGPMKLIWKIQ